MLTNETLQQLTEQLSLRFFGRSFRHKAYVNKRLRTTGGRYLLRSHDIEVNEAYFNQYGEKEIIGILKHELCHYHLHLEGKGYRHGDPEFKELLKKTGAPRHCRPLEAKKAVSANMLRYVCTSCGLQYNRRRRVNVQKYACGVCRGKLKELFA